jgi:hypothetical protein
LCDSDGSEEGFLDKLNEFTAGRTLFEVAPRQGFRENSNFNFAASSLPVALEPMTLIFIVSFFGE